MKKRILRRSCRSVAPLAGRAAIKLVAMLLLENFAFSNPQARHALKADPSRTYFYEQDFVTNPSLVALPNQASVLTLQSASGSSSSLQQHVVRYQLAAGAYNFCLKGDPSLASMTATNASGQVDVNLSLNACSTVTLLAGTYQINVVHDPSKITGKPRTIFVQLPTRHVNTNNPDGTVKGGYWALQPDPAQDPTGADRAGRLHALPQQNLVPPGSGSDPVYGMPVAADWTSAAFDDTALLRLDQPRLFSGDIPLNFRPLGGQTGTYPVLMGDSDPANPKFPSKIEQVVIDDRADGSIRIGATSTTIFPFLVFDFFYTSPRWAFVDTTSFVTFPPFLLAPSPFPPSLLAHLLFRFYPESKNLSPPADLDEGEVALFQSCSFGGDAAIFSRNIADLTALASGTAKVSQASAVKLGSNTEVVLYSGPNFSGTSQLITANTNCLEGLPIGTSIGSLQIRSSVIPLNASADCLRCQLAAIDLSNSTLDAAVLSGTDLSTANLTSASLNGATFEDVNLTHATISQVILDGADMKGTTWSGVDLKTAGSLNSVILDRAYGFAGVDLTGLTLTGASLKEIDFNFTNLTNARLSAVDLSGANLAGSKLIGAQVTNKSILRGADFFLADLSGAQMSDTDLSNSVFSNTKLGADFTGAHLDGGYFAISDLSSATLNGTSFNGSRLALAVLNGAKVNSQTTFAGADIGNATYTIDQLRAVNLYQAVFDGNTLSYQDLSGINFSGASFKGVTFHNVTCGGPTNFTGADLTGAIFQQEFTSHSLSGCNFNGAQLQKATFQSAIDFSQGIVLGSSTFQGAKLQGASLVAADFSGADFTGAFLNGANLQGAILSRPLSLKNATLDGALGLANGDLTGAQLNSVSLQNTNLSGAKLYGAQLNDANLDGSNLSGAFLTKSPTGGVAASLEGAFLRNVNLSQAQMSGADFTNASFYGTIAAGTGSCQSDPNTGFTNSCASAAGAVLNNTQFGGAYLFGVDFTGAQIQGVQFANTFLAGANFSKATLAIDPSIGTNSGLSASFLQGTNLDPKSLQGVSLLNAFVDFSPQGNTIYLPLNGNHTSFFGYWGTRGEAVCAEMSYSGPSVAPTNNSTITCPNGQSYPAGCGTAASSTPLNPNWESSTDITQIASYQFNATYTNAPSAPICAYDPQWLQAPQLGSRHRPKPTSPHRRTP